MPSSDDKPAAQATTDSADKVDRYVKAGFVEQRVVLDEAGIARGLRRVALEIVERNQGTGNLLLVGIRTRGVFLAERLQALIKQAEDVAVPLGVLDITLYRDDVLTGLPDPEVKPTSLPVSVADQRVVLVDDVLFTGRTVRAALDAVMDFGRPRTIQLAVLVDRGHRELPVQADYVGTTITTDKDQHAVRVRLRESDEREEVVLLQKRSAD